MGGLTRHAADGIIGICRDIRFVASRTSAARDSWCPSGPKGIFPPAEVVLELKTLEAPSGKCPMGPLLCKGAPNRWHVPEQSNKEV